MFTGMTSCADHSYFLPKYNLAFEAHWPRPARTCGSLIRGLFTDAPAGRSPDPDALARAVSLLEAQDIHAATMAFTELGYEVTLQAHTLR